MSLSIKLITIAGVILLLSSGLLLWERNNPSRLSFASYETSQVNKNSHQLVSIDIPSLKLHLPIYLSKITNNQWPTTKKGVSYLASSPLPGSRGNSIFYGHNYPTILGSLHKVKVGQPVIVTYANGKSYTFYVTGIAEVTPDQTHILQNSTDTRITVYTCSGFLDSKRLVVTAVANEKPHSAVPEL